MARWLVLAAIVIGAAAFAQQPQTQTARPGITVPPLGDGPYVFDTGEQHKIRVVVLSKDLSHPWSMAFLPDGAILITERAGRLRVFRNGVLDPKPVAGIPEVKAQALQGLMDIALHPKFSENKLIYFTYHKPNPNPGPNAPANTPGVITLARGRWNGSALENVTDIFSSIPDTNASRMAFGKDGMIYMGVGIADPPNAARAQDKNDLAGKVLRLKDDGTIPPDNPFVGKTGYRPEIFTMGHRNPMGLVVHPETGAIWENEDGPNGGDEINILQARKELRMACRQRRAVLCGPTCHRKTVPGRHGKSAGILGAIDCNFRNDRLHRRPFPQLERQCLRRRHEAGRDPGHRTPSTRRLQQQDRRNPARTDAG